MFEHDKDSAEISGTIASNFQRLSEKNSEQLYCVSVRTTRRKIESEDTVLNKDEFEAPSPTSTPNVNIICASNSASNMFVVTH